MCLCIPLFLRVSTSIECLSYTVQVTEVSLLKQNLFVLAEKQRNQERAREMKQLSYSFEECITSYAKTHRTDVMPNTDRELRALPAAALPPPLHCPSLTP